MDFSIIPKNQIQYVTPFLGYLGLASISGMGGYGLGRIKQKENDDKKDDG